MMSALIQIRYKLRQKLAPTRKQIDEIRERWLETGQKPQGCTIEPIVWGKHPGTVIGHLRSLPAVKSAGCPGIVERYAGPGLVMTDFDHSRPVGICKIAWISRTLDLRVRWIVYERTNRGWHVTIQYAARLTAAETTALQAILGSDYHRETYNLARVRSGKTANKRWNLLFKSKLA